MHQLPVVNTDGFEIIFREGAERGKILADNSICKFIFGSDSLIFILTDRNPERLVYLRRLLEESGRRQCENPHLAEAIPKDRVLRGSIL